MAKKKIAAQKSNKSFLEANKYAVGYIIAVLLLSWIVQTILFTGLLPGKFTVLYMYVPALLAIIFYFIQKTPVKVQLKQVTNKISLQSILFAIGYPFLLSLALIAASLITGLGQFNPEFFSGIFTIPFLISYLGMVAVILPSMFGEEAGWRGYLLPSLVANMSKTKATLLVGFVWGLWHIPSYYLAYSAAGIGNPILLTFLGFLVNIMIAFPVSYCYFLTKNIIPCILLHGIYDIHVAHLVFGSPEIPGMTIAVSSIISMEWIHVLLALIIVQLLFVPWFILQFRKMGEK